MTDVAKQERIALLHVTKIAQGGVGNEYFAPNATAWSTASGMMTGEQYLSKLPLLPGIFEEPLVMTIDGITAQPGKVAIQCRSKGTLLGGIPYSNDYHMLVEFDDQDRITHVREYMDTVRANEALMPLVRQRVAELVAAST